MTDKQKQIKEISELISNYYHNGSFVRKGSLSEMIYDKLFPKDCVVLSREEYEHINSCYNVVRKETAKKYHEFISNSIKNAIKMYSTGNLKTAKIVDICSTISLDNDEIAKQFSVERGKDH